MVWARNAKTIKMKNFHWLLFFATWICWFVGGCTGNSQKQITLDFPEGTVVIDSFELREESGFLINPYTGIRFNGVAKTKTKDRVFYEIIRDGLGHLARFETTLDGKITSVGSCWEGVDSGPRIEFDEVGNILMLTVTEFTLPIDSKIAYADGFARGVWKQNEQGEKRLVPLTFSPAIKSVTK